MSRLVPLQAVPFRQGYEWTSVRWLRRLVHDRRLPHVKVGGKVLIDLDELDRLAEQGRRGGETSIPLTDEATGLTLFPMDPSIKNQHWQWGSRTAPHMKVAVACVLWELHENGPAEHPNGRAPGELAKRLRARNAPYQALPNRAPVIKDVINYARRYLGDLVERDTVGQNTFRLALRHMDDPGQQLPPYPFERSNGDRPQPQPQPQPVQSAAVTGNGAAPHRAEADDADMADDTEPPTVLTPAEALAAVAAFANEALKLAGVVPDDAADVDHLAEAMAENRRLQELLDRQGSELLHKLKENEVLKRALSKRA